MVDKGGDKAVSKRRGERKEGEWIRECEVRGERKKERETVRERREKERAHFLGTCLPGEKREGLIFQAHSSLLLQLALDRGSWHLEDKGSRRKEKSRRALSNVDELQLTINGGSKHRFLDVYISVLWYLGHHYSLDTLQILR